jgi:hypothetical protein
MSVKEIAVGDRFVSKHDAAIKGEVISKRLLLDIQHYELRIESPGSAPRSIIVSRDGILIKFNPE